MKKCPIICLVGLAVLLTGCPHNEYTIELTPHGNAIERKLVFYREDGVNTNGTPNYQVFDSNELANIAACYPATGLIHDGDRHTVRGRFTNALPGDVGGAGFYTNLATSLGNAGFYAEHFRGTDDLATLTEKRFQAADKLADLLIGWSRMELGRETNYENLRAFLNMDFRRDVKNGLLYWWLGQVTSNYRTNAGEEYVVRFGQYLTEHGYLKPAEIPNLFGFATIGNEHAWMQFLQRLVARKMGVPDAAAVPTSLAFLGDTDSMDKSFKKYLAGTETYRARLKQWEEEKKLNPALPQPDPTEVAGEQFNNLMELDLFGDENDHLAVRLSLPFTPTHTNGRWDEVRKQVVWESDLPLRTNLIRLPVSCYAAWSQADDSFQNKHFGRVAVSGDQLTQYCLWRAGLDQPQATEWDALLAGLQPGNGLLLKLAAFHFSSEPVPAGTNAQNQAKSAADFGRSLIQDGLNLDVKK